MQEATARLAIFLLGFLAGILYMAVERVMSNREEKAHHAAIQTVSGQQKEGAEIGGSIDLKA